jgi:hypothetical protein
VKKMIVEVTDCSIYWVLYNQYTATNSEYIKFTLGTCIGSKCFKRQIFDKRRAGVDRFRVQSVAKLDVSAASSVKASLQNVKERRNAN